MSEVQTQTLRNHRVDRLLVDLQELIINGYRIVNGTVRQAGAEVLVTVERSVKQDETASVKDDAKTKVEPAVVKTEAQEEDVKTAPVRTKVKTAASKATNK